MIQTPEELSKLLKSTPLENSNIVSLEIPESKDIALAIEIPRKNKFRSWQLMRSLVKVTGRYPILTDIISPATGNWEQDVVEEDFFSRLDYEEEQKYSYLKNIAPESIIDAAKSIDGEKAIENRIEEHISIAEENWREADWCIYELEETKRNFSTAPSLQETEAVLNSGKIITKIDFERWLFNWEVENIPRSQLLKLPKQVSVKTDCESSFLFEYSSSKTTTLLLLPTTNTWDTLAYIHFYGAINSAEAIAILKYWHDLYSAELITCYLTILEFDVKQLPKSFDAAFKLAAQHYIFAPYDFMVGGTSIRSYALYLMEDDYWCLHERP